MLSNAPVSARGPVASGAIGEVISATITASFNSLSVGRRQQDGSIDAGVGLPFAMGIH